MIDKNNKNFAEWSHIQEVLKTLEMKRKTIAESYKEMLHCTLQDLDRFKREEEIFRELYSYIEKHKGEPYEEYTFIADIKKSYWLEMTISKDSINIEFPTDFGMVHDLEILLISLRDAISGRIFSDNNPDVYDYNYSLGLSVSLERWNAIKSLGLYKDLNKLEEEVCKNLILLQSIKSSKSWKEDVVLDIVSLLDFCHEINSDMHYILSSKPLRNLTIHPNFLN